jgi:hypothetical protein
LPSMPRVTSRLLLVDAEENNAGIVTGFI